MTSTFQIQSERRYDYCSSSVPQTEHLRLGQRCRLIYLLIREEDETVDSWEIAQLELSFAVCTENETASDATVDKGNGHDYPYLVASNIADIVLVFLCAKNADIGCSYRSSSRISR